MRTTTRFEHLRKLIRNRSLVKGLVLLVPRLHPHIRLSTVCHIHVHAGRIDLWLSIRQRRVITRKRRPIPDPVKRVRLTTGRIRRQTNVRLTPHIGTHNLIRLMRELSLTILRDLAAVDLIATTIIEVLLRQQDTALVTPGPVLVPHLVNIKELLVLLGLRRPIDIHRPTILRLPLLRLRHSDMAVLLEPQSDARPSRCLKTRVIIICLFRLALAVHAHHVGFLDFATVRREDMGHGFVAEVGRGAGDVASGVSWRTNEGSIRGDGRELFDPGMGVGCCCEEGGQHRRHACLGDSHID